MEILRDRTRVLYLTMALLLTLATALGSFASVCRAPCCMPHLAKVEASVRAEHSCCADQATSSREEVARFFAQDFDDKAPVLLADDPGQCQMKSTDQCVASLRLGTEYTPAPTISFDHHTPAASLATADHHAITPAWVSRPSPFSGTTPLPPGSPPVYLTTSSFLC